MMKTKTLIVRVTENELNMISDASIEIFGKPNKSRLIRKIIRGFLGMSPDLNDRELSEFREAVRQLTGIARNLNQMTARIHQDEKQLSMFSVNYLDKINEHVKDVNVHLKNYISCSLKRSQDVIAHE